MRQLGGIRKIPETLQVARLALQKTLTLVPSCHVLGEIISDDINAMCD